MYDLLSEVFATRLIVVLDPFSAHTGLVKTVEASFTSDIASLHGAV